MLNRQYFILFLLLLFSLNINVFGQSREQRVVQWDSYQLPTGKFTRFVNEEKGYWFWHPADWQEKQDNKGNPIFSQKAQGPKLLILVDNIPEGYGLANYSSSLLKEFRKAAIKQESFTNRVVSVDGIETREFHFEIESQGIIVHETLWITVVGPHVYTFLFVFAPTDEEAFEPYIKRIMQTVRFGSAGHWNKEFETLRANFNDSSIADSELTENLIAEEIRDNKTPPSQWTTQLTELLAKAPRVAVDLLTDSDPHVRGAAITLLSKNSDPKINDILLWALTDSDTYCSALAAQAIAERGEPALEALKKQIPNLIEKPGIILRISAAFSNIIYRQAIYDEAIKTNKLPDWTKEALTKLNAQTNSSLSNNSKLNAQELAKLIDAPTTGATLFPKNSTHYLLAPNFQNTLEKLDTSLSQIQLDTVRDQMTLALIIKSVKAQLATHLQAGVNSDINSLVGINFKAPLSLAGWSIDNQPEHIISHSAVVVQVSDRSRFERSLTLYQDQFGSFDSFVTVSATISRIAGITPAIIPVALAAVFIDEGTTEQKREVKPTHKESFFQHQAINGLPLTIIERVAVFESKPTEQNSIFILYLGDTAVVSSSQEAMEELLQAATTQTTIGQSESFLQTISQSGEVLFFSHLGDLIKSISSNTATTQNPFNSLPNLIGDEMGSLHLNKSSCETLFHLNLSAQAFANIIKPFQPNDLKAPVNLLPDNTVFYAGARFDMVKSLELLKLTLGIKEQKDKKKTQSASDIEIEQKVVPALEGEVAFAFISIKPFMAKLQNKKGETDSNNPPLPATIVALKLKDNSLANQFRDNKLFKGLTRLSGINVLNAPVAVLPINKIQFFLSITNDYLIITDSVETLRSLEKSEKFANTRDYSRSAKAISHNIALFATYNLDSAFDEATSLMADNPAAKQVLTVMSAVLHSFHSQYASIAINNSSLEGCLAVAFDREGRYSVGQLAEQANDFNVANAIITAKGINIVQSDRIESLKVRVTTKSDIINRVQDDINKFPWQQIETNSSNNALVLKTSARPVPDNHFSLPVQGDEFAPYLRATTRINSNAPEIIALAKQIVGNDNDSRSVARKLGEWTYHNLKWKKVESDTVETLTSHEADCLEHSELYVALARASGLPARVVTGAVLSGGSFGAHAWVEVYLVQDQATFCLRWSRCSTL